jgi:hypothetical protein
VLSSRYLPQFLTKNPSFFLLNLTIYCCGSGSGQRREHEQKLMDPPAKKIAQV